MKTLLKVTANILIILILIVTVLNLIVFIPSMNNVVSESRAKNMAKEVPFDAIVVLGCSAKNGMPSHMLSDRLDKAIELYKNGVCEKVLMSGDESEGYSEVKVMHDYAVRRGVPDEAILIDNRGYSTIESMRRLRDEYSFSRVVVVTQKYHTYRAVYIGDKFGIDSVAVAADARSYSGQIFRDIREVAARIKDLFYCMLW